MNIEKRGGPAYSISEVARAAGISSRTLRHYDQIGLLPPSSTTPGGYRCYSPAALVRLQRILVLRGMGLGLEAIGSILDTAVDEAAALKAHMADLEKQRARIERQIAALARSIKHLETGAEMTPQAAFRGFNEQYEEEVSARWGAEAYRQSTAWWSSQSEKERQDFMGGIKELNRSWAEAGASGADPSGEEAQQLAGRHVQWLCSIPGTPAANGDQQQLRGYVLGLAQMYVADERFAANYAGQAGFVKEALEIFVQRALD